MGYASKGSKREVKNVFPLVKMTENTDVYPYTLTATIIKTAYLNDSKAEKKKKIVLFDTCNNIWRCSGEAKL